MSEGQVYHPSLKVLMERIEFAAYAKTASACIQYTVELCVLTPDVFNPYVDRARFSELCERGCLNYARKWSCPPFAPDFTAFTANWHTLVVLYMHTELNQFFYIKNDYLKIKAANSILKSRADAFLQKMSAQHGTYISSGSCRLCKPCKCKCGLTCAHPERMTYSFEALGVDVSQVVDKCFRRPLLWYHTHTLPMYTSVVCGLLSNEMPSLAALQSAYLDGVLR